MRRLRNDLPYTFRPPQMTKAFRPLVMLVNDRQLKKNYRIAKVEQEGFEKLRELHEAGHSIMLAPNHSDHSDPHVLMDVAHRFGMSPYFMGAREIFEGSKLTSWALQKSGVFSVDRDGPDLAAIKTAISLLEAAEEPLVMFPEGEIYHHHRRIDPLNEGVASILMKAAGRMKSGKKAYLVPVAMSFYHGDDIADTYVDRLSALEERIGWTPKPAMPVDERIVRLALGALALKEVEFLGVAGQGAIQDRLAQLCENLLTDVEGRHTRDSKATTPPERVRALRYRIRKQLLDEENPPTKEMKHQLLDDLDRVFSALQAHSYIGDYLLADPTRDRRAEMVMKLEEDLTGFPEYLVDRTAKVMAGEPICVTDLIESGDLPKKGGAAILTERLEKELQRLLDQGS